MRQILAGQLPIFFMFLSAVTGVLFGLLIGMDIIWSGRLRKWKSRKRRHRRKVNRKKDDCTHVIEHIKEREEVKPLERDEKGQNRLRNRMNDELESDLSLICQEKDTDIRTQLRRYMSAQENGYLNLRKHRKK